MTRESKLFLLYPYNSYLIRITSKNIFTTTDTGLGVQESSPPEMLIVHVGGEPVRAHGQGSHEDGIDALGRLYAPGRIVVNGAPNVVAIIPRVQNAMFAALLKKFARH